MKWRIERPRKVAEDDKVWAEVEADTLEEAIRGASFSLYDSTEPRVGEVYCVSLRVVVVSRPSLPLKSV